VWLLHIMPRLHGHRPPSTSTKTVRIALPPSPPPDHLEMDSPAPSKSNPPAPSESNPPVHRHSDRILSQRDRIVLPTDAVKEPERLRSGSRWRQHDLALLRVKFDPDVDSRLAVLDGLEWTTDQCRGNMSSLPPPPTQALHVVCRLLTVCDSR
jgi:hypothetical protein